MKFQISGFKVSRFWFIYFVVRLFYLLFSVLVFPTLTTFGDPIHYMTSGIPFPFTSSTDLMRFLGGILGSVLGGFNVVSNFPFMLLSFGLIKWAVDILDIRNLIDDKILLIILSLPTFCIWTSVCSKECIGLFFSAILGILIVHYLNGNFKIHFRDYVAFSLCLFFKPQYLPFIVSTLFYLRFAFGLHSRRRLIILSVFYVSAIIFVLYLSRDLIDLYSLGVQKAFEFDSQFSNSTRDTLFFVNKYDYFSKAPMGIFIAFWGPTLTEALQKPFQMAVYIESFVVLCVFIYFLKTPLKKLIVNGIVNLRLIVSYSILFLGILLVHYPFGVFNAGSATIYRTNYLFLFIILLMYLFSYYRKKNDKVDTLFGC